jgi:acetylglutamate kinase
MKGDLGWVGEVTDCKLGLIQAAVAGEFVPVVSPVARELASGDTSTSMPTLPPALWPPG